MFTRAVICIKIQSRSTLNTIILTRMEMLPTKTIFMKSLSEVFIPTSITDLEIKGRIPCKSVTTSITKKTNAKLYLYGMKYFRILKKLFRCCSISAALSENVAVGSNNSTAPCFSSFKIHPSENSL